MYQLAQWIVRNKAIAFAVAAMTVIAMAPDEGEGTLLPSPDAVDRGQDRPWFTVPKHRDQSAPPVAATRSIAEVGDSADEEEEVAPASDPAGEEAGDNGGAPRVIYAQPPRRVRPPKAPEY